MPNPWESAGLNRLLHKQGGVMGYAEDAMAELHGWGPVAHVSTVQPLEVSQVHHLVEAVEREIARQHQLAREGKFGGTHILPSGPDHARLGVLLEEVGEVARELNEELMGRGDRTALIKELIQVGACAVAWATALEAGR